MSLPTRPTGRVVLFSVFQLPSVAKSALPGVPRYLSEDCRGLAGIKQTKLIHEISVLLVAEFGFDHCFSIWIGDGQVAASSSSVGYIVPLVAAESLPVAS